MTEDHDLRSSLDGLARLTQGRGQQGLEDILEQVAVFALRAIPHADGAGVTLVEEHRSNTIVATSDFVRAVDAIQYGIGEGPCITAAAEARTVTSGALGQDGAWPHFGPKASEIGVHSALSLPLLVGDTVLGALNVYAHAPEAFDPRAIGLGELFAIPAAISVKNAQALAQAHRLVSQLETALTSRAVIDQALGIVMSRTGVTAEEAFAKLRAMSRTDGRKLSVVAEHIVEEAVRRARARRPGR